MRQRVLVGAVVRIWTAGSDAGADTIVGTGFLVSPRFVITCAHVVADALNLDDVQASAVPEQPVLLDFPATIPGHFYPASVTVWHPRTPQPGGIYDIAGLELAEDAPGQPVRLALLEDPWNRPCRVFGFPAGRPDGSYAEGALKDVLANGWVMIRGGDDAREFVRRGYSGGPVYTEDGVVGMLTEGDASGRVRESAMIPVSALLTAWPELYTLNATCPYQGLASFDESSARFFFGREEATTRLMAAIESATQPTILAGGSGSGKSSLVAAGLVPELRQAGWEACTFQPGNMPFSALAHALLRLWQPDLFGTALLLEQQRLAAGLRSGVLSLSNVSASILECRSAETRLLISVDQFEELFTLGGAGDAAADGAAEAFLEQLVGALADLTVGNRVRLLLSVRTDFLDRLLVTPQTASWHREEGFVHYLGGVAELERVMEGPLGLTGLGRFEAGLVERIKNDLTQVESALPLLEFTLTELWHSQEGGMLTHRAYDDLGGVGMALANYAQSIYERLTIHEREGAKRLFLQLMQPGSEGTVTRRVARLSEFGPNLRPVISLLAGKRLVVTGRSPEQPDAVEVVHEALFEHWPLLKRWVTEGWDFRRWQESLRTALNDWEGAGEAEDYLLQGARLTAAQEYAAANSDFLTASEIRFIQASADLHERRRREAEARLQLEAMRQRRTNQILASALAVTLLFSAAAAWQWSRAQRQTTRAEAFSGRLQQTNSKLEASTAAAQVNARRALASTLGAQGLLATDRPGANTGDPRLGALLAVQAVAVDNSLKTRGNLLRVVERAPMPESNGAPLVAVSPDGSSLIIASQLSTEVWDTAMRTKRYDLPVENAPDEVAYSPDGTILATAIPGVGVQLWDARKGDSKGEPLPDTGAYVVNLVFSPSGEHLLVGSIDGNLELWDVSRRKVVGRLVRPNEVSPPEPRTASLPFRTPVTVSPSEEHLNWLTSLMFDPTGRTLAVAGAAGEVWIYSGFDLKPLRKLDTATMVRSLAFSPDGRRLALGNRDGSVAVWSVTTGKRLGEVLEGLTSVPQSLAFSASGRRLAAGDAAGHMLVWDLSTRASYRLSTSFAADRIGLVRFIGEQLMVEGEEGQRAALWSMSRRGDMLQLDASLRATYNDDRSLSLWRVEKDQLRSLLGDTTDSFLVQAVYHPSGERFATRTNERTVQLWDAATAHPVGDPVADQSDIESIAFSHDGRLLATGDREGGVIFRNGLTGKAVRVPLPLDIPRALSIAFSPDGRRMAVSTEGDVAVWDVSQNKLVGRPEWDIRAIERMDLVHVVTYSPDGQWLLGGYMGYVYVWRADTLELMKVLPSMAEDRNVRDVVFSPDGKQVVVTYNDGSTAATWGVPGWKHQRTVLEVSSVAFSLDGRLLAAGGPRRVTFHDPVTFEAIGDPVEVHESGVRVVAFSPDGRTLLSGDEANLNFRWRTTLRAWLDVACARGERNLSGLEWVQYLGDVPYKKTCAAFGVDATAVNLLLRQASELADAGQSRDASTLYTRAVRYAAGHGDARLIQAACRAGSAYLDGMVSECDTAEATRAGK